MNLNIVCVSKLAAARLGLLFIVFLVATANAAGEVDTAFNASIYKNVKGEVHVIKKQADGKILIGGNFLVVDGKPRGGIARLNSDGTLDSTFDPPDFTEGINSVRGLGRLIETIAVQADGKILVGGYDLGVYGTNNRGVWRLNPDGSLDTGFVTELTTGSGYVKSIQVESSGSILVAGYFDIFNTPYEDLIRLNPDGTLDNTFPSSFQGYLTNVLTLPGGGFLISGSISPTPGSGGYLLKYHVDGTPDGSFSTGTINGVIEDIELLADGKIMIAGAFGAINGFQQGGIARLNADGSLDTTFNTNQTGANSIVKSLDVSSKGKIVIAGLFSAYNGETEQRALIQLNADGSRDTAFTSPFAGIPSIDEVIFFQNGRVLAGFTNGPEKGLVQYNSDGSVDTTRDYRLGIGHFVRKIQQQIDGKLVVAGDFFVSNGQIVNGIVRLNADGSNDPTFIPYFPNPDIVANRQRAFAMAVQPDGKILVGIENGKTLARLNTDGTEDVLFNPVITGAVYDLDILPSGKIIIGGQFTIGGLQRKVARLNSDGSLDAGFNVTQPNNTVLTVIVQPDEKVLIGGSFSQLGAVLRGRIARLNADGTLDTGFNPPGGANQAVYDIDIQGDGKVVIGGVFTALNGSQNHAYLGRLNTDGSLDTGFVPSVTREVYAVKVAPTGKVLWGGGQPAGFYYLQKRFGRLNADGSEDTVFDPGTGANDIVGTISLQSDGKVLLGGQFTNVDGHDRISIVRLLDNAVPQTAIYDFDGDGKSDISVFRPSENKWYILRSSDFQVVQQVFGIPGDSPVAADMDGDGITDYSIFRNSNGDWWSLGSVSGSQVFAHLGQNGDIPRPSDFDGDGIADYVVYRPSNFNWYRVGSISGQVSDLQFGAAGDKPLIGDFDGDGKTDVAIYRPATGDWWWQSSADGVQRATHWGISTDIPSPGDYDGDGITDFAVYRPSDGLWYILNSSSGNTSATIIKFGIAEDKPVPADYDGDGKTDIAVYRPSTGIWYLLKSAEGFAAIKFGVSTDIPIPNALIP